MRNTAPTRVVIGTTSVDVAEVEGPGLPVKSIFQIAIDGLRGQ